MTDKVEMPTGVLLAAVARQNLRGTYLPTGAEEGGRLLAASTSTVTAE